MSDNSLSSTWKTLKQIALQLRGNRKVHAKHLFASCLIYLEAPSRVEQRRSSAFEIISIDNYHKSAEFSLKDVRIRD